MTRAHTDRPNSDELIALLSRQVTPVKAAKLGLSAALYWAIASAMGLALAVHLLGPRSDVAIGTIPVHVLLELVGAAGAAFAFAHSAIRLLVPGRRLLLRDLVLGALGTLVVVAATFQVGVGAAAPWAGLNIGGVACTEKLALFALAPGLALVILARRFAPTRLLAAGCHIGAAAAAIGFGALIVVCPVDDAVHLAVYHLLPAVIAASLGGAFIGRILRW